MTLVSEPSAGGRDVFGRTVLPLRCSEIAELERLEPPSPAFVLLVAADVRPCSDDELRDITARLFDRGAVYLLAWGPGCERLEALADEVVMHRTPAGEDPVIMTTSHPDDTLRTALHFAMKFAVADETFDADCRSLVVAVVDHDGWYIDAVTLLHETLTSEPPVT